MFRFKEYVSIVVESENVKVLSSDKLYKVPIKYLNVIKRLKKGVLRENENKENKELIDFFKSKDLLIKNKDYSKIDYKKNLFYYEGYTDDPIKLNDKFKNYSVGLIGCGGVGTVLIDQLIALNIKKIALVDYDVVEKSNLNRQFIFIKDDIGKVKTEVLKKYCLNKNENLEIITYTKKIMDLSDLKCLDNLDIIINAADTPYNLNDIVIEFCGNKKIDYITCGVGIHSGYIGPLLNFSSEKTEKFNFKKDKVNIKKQLKPVQGSLGITNSLISSMMLNEFFKYKSTGTCNCLNKIMKIDFKKYNIQYKNI